jgi:hypothetical protein
MQDFKSPLGDLGESKKKAEGMGDLGRKREATGKMQKSKFVTN